MVVRKLTLVRLGSVYELTIADLTTSGYNLVMSNVGIAELKAKLSEKLGDVRRGETITVLDRKTPIAMIIPIRFDHEPLRMRRAAGKRKLGRIPLPPPVDVKQDVVSLLLEDRARR